MITAAALLLSALIAAAAWVHGYYHGAHEMRRALIQRLHTQGAHLAADQLEDTDT